LRGGRKNERKIFRRRKKMTPSDEELVKWYDARDTFLGINYVERNLCRGLELAHALSAETKNAIPEAAWLCSLFPNTNVTPRDVCAAYAKNKTVTAAVYAVLLLHKPPDQWMSRLFEHPLFAAIKMPTARRLGPETLGRLAETREPRGFYERWTRGRDAADLKRAAELGLVEAWWDYGMWRFHLDDPEGYAWRGRAAQRGFKTQDFLYDVARYLSRFLISNALGSSACIVQMDALYGKGALSVERLPGRAADRDVMRHIRDLCKNWRADARCAVDTWLAIGRRLHVVRDIRRVIGKRIWNEWMRDVEYAPIVPIPYFEIRSYEFITKCSMRCTNKK
jgi:hypothetical protein